MTGPPPPPEPLPPLTSMIAADEYTLTPAQEQALLDQRRVTDKRSRWYSAPTDTYAPGLRAEGHAFVEGWLDPWVQLNDPATDDMVGVTILQQGDSTRGMLILVNPTWEAELCWREYSPPLGAESQSGIRFCSIAAETALMVDPPAVDYRVVFRRCEPLPRISTRSLRFRFQPAGPGLPGFEVASVRWHPRQKITAGVVEG